MQDVENKITNRLKRAEGQLRGIQKMIAEEQDCEAIVTQLTAVRSSIDRTIGIVVAENLKECLMALDGDDDAQNEKIEKAMAMIVKK